MKLTEYEFIYELKKQQKSKWNIIELIKKNKQLTKKILSQIDKKLLQNLTQKEINLLLG